VQPVQLSLIPQEVPAPPAQVLGQLPDPDVGMAVSLLARLIAATLDPSLAGEGDDGE
jgi:hypothetical protein